MANIDTLDWDKRYEKEGLKAPGTFAHTEAGNAQFYRAKCDALDRCMDAVGSSFAGKRVLDAAGGSGQFISYYLNKGASHVTIADYSQVALQWVRRRWRDESRVQTVFMDLSGYVPELAESPYDVVLVQEAIFLLRDDAALAEAIHNLARYLTHRGHLLISDVFPQERVVACSYVIRRPRTMFEDLFAQYGLTTLAYVPQSVLFNRALFGRVQPIVEQVGSLYYWLDRIARRWGMTPIPDVDIKYAIARKE